MATPSCSAIASVSQNAPQAPVLNPAEMLKIHSKALKASLRMAAQNQCGIQMSEWKDRKLTEEIEMITLAGESHRRKLAIAAAAFKSAILSEYPDAEVWMCGSYAAGVDLPTSDLDFSMRIPSMTEETDYLKLAAIKNRWTKHQEFMEVQLTRGNIPVFMMRHDETRVHIDCTIDNDTPKRNTQLLAMYGQVDPRFSKLCRAIKKLAADTGMENSRKGRLNSFSHCLKLIHFLQCGVTPPVLPNLQEILPELQGQKTNLKNDDYRRPNLLEELELKGVQIGQNKSSLGALYWGFIKYYSNFDFLSNWISVRKGTVLEKKMDEEGNPLNGLPLNNTFIVLEDPFLEEPWNCAATLRQLDIFERYREEFHAADEDIRQFHRISKSISYEREKINDDGELRDMQVYEIEEAIEQWCDENWRTVDKDSRLYRMDPTFYYDKKSIVHKPWPLLARNW